MMQQEGQAAVKPMAAGWARIQAISGALDPRELIRWEVAGH